MLVHHRIFLWNITKREYDALDASATAAYPSRFYVTPANTFLLWPVLVMMVVAFSLGVGLVLSLLNVYFRDVEYLIALQAGDAGVRELGRRLQYIKKHTGDSLLSRDMRDFLEMLITICDMDHDEFEEG